MTARYQVIGLREWNSGLRKVDQDLPKAQREIHLKLAEIVARDARGRVRSRSGRLRGSIRPLAGQRYARVRAGRKGLDARSGYDYSRINHYGGYPGRYQGNPFFEEALSANEEKISRTYVREMEGLVDRAFKGV